MISQLYMSVLLCLDLVFFIIHLISLPSYGYLPLSEYKIRLEYRCPPTKIM